MSYKATQVSTQQCSEALSKPWPKAFDVVKLAIIEKKSCLRKPSMTFREQACPETTSI